MAEPGLAHVAEQFDDAEQQRSAAELGMWVFLATEVMFFGGMILAYTTYRWLYPSGFAVGSRHMDVVIGAVNTAVLLGSSLTVVLAVDAARTGARRLLLASLGATIVLGLVFLGFKAYEWWHHWHEGLVPALHFTYTGPHAPEVALFFWLYFAMTGVHALHLAIGVVVMAVLGVLAWRGRFGPLYSNPVEVAGLYWHFVDVVWIFLLPLLYLIGRHA